MTLQTTTIAEKGLKLIEFKDFKITTQKQPILNQKELSDLPFEFPAPEMLFGNNFIRVETKGIKIEFNAIDALKHVSMVDEIKVSYSEEWNRSHNDQHGHIKEVIKPFDWTFQTKYRGTSNTKFNPTDKRINMELLQRQDPILFYEQLMLFEDELGDNGTCILSLRTRVMDSCFLVLMQYFLRVDGVIVKIFDTRLFHEFNSNYILRSYTERSAKYDSLLQVRNINENLPITTFGRDIATLNNIDYVSKAIKDVDFEEYEEIIIPVC